MVVMALTAAAAAHVPRRGRRTDTFFLPLTVPSTGRRTFVIKSREQIQRQQRAPEPPPERYVEARDLFTLVTTYAQPSWDADAIGDGGGGGGAGDGGEEEEEEEEEEAAAAAAAAAAACQAWRVCFVHLLAHVLHLDPAKRWTAAEYARTGTPPPSLPRSLARSLAGWLVLVAPPRTWTTDTRGLTLGALGNTGRWPTHF
jgi:hypothetical protein